MRLVLLAFALTPLLLGIGACGTASSRSHESEVAASLAGGGDSESKAVDHDDERYPNDDTPASGYNSRRYVATPADRREVAALVRRYYAAALGGDGAKACSMLVSTLAKALPQDYGQAPGPRYLRSKTCAAVASRLFKHFHKQIVIEVPVLTISAMRFHEEHGTVTLTFAASRLPKLEFLVEREHGVWKAGAPLGFAS